MGAGSSAVVDHAEPGWDFTALAATALRGDRSCRYTCIGHGGVRISMSRADVRTAFDTVLELLAGDDKAPTTADVVCLVAPARTVPRKRTEAISRQARRTIKRAAQQPSGDRNQRRNDCKRAQLRSSPKLVQSASSIHCNMRTVVLIDPAQYRTAARAEGSWSMISCSTSCEVVRIAGFSANEPRTYGVNATVRFWNYCCDTVSRMPCRGDC